MPSTSANLRVQSVDTGHAMSDMSLGFTVQGLGLRALGAFKIRHQNQKDPERDPNLENYPFGFRV